MSKTIKPFTASYRKYLRRSLRRRILSLIDLTRSAAFSGAMRPEEALETEKALSRCKNSLDKFIRKI